MQALILDILSDTIYLIQPYLSKIVGQRLYVCSNNNKLIVVLISDNLNKIKKENEKNWIATDHCDQQNKLIII